MPNSLHDAWSGHRVEFLIQDVHVPEPATILLELHGGDALRGSVIDVSDGETKGGGFLVIQCDGLRGPCVLAVERVHRID